MDELGLLVPLLDLANHASQDKATAYLAIDFSKAGKHDLPAANGPFINLVAARDIQHGEQVCGICP